MGCSAFARHYLRNHCCFLFLRVLRCFSSPGMPPRKDTLERVGCPIRKSADHSSFATPRSLSQLYTSFFASACLGIHRVPLIAYFIWLALPSQERKEHTQLLELLLLWAAHVLPRAATLGACYHRSFTTNTSNILYELTINRSSTLYIVIYFFTMSKNPLGGGQLYWFAQRYRVTPGLSHRQAV